MNQAVSQQVVEKQPVNPTPSTNVATLPALAPVKNFVQQVDIFSDPASFEHAQRVAKVFASSNLVPPHFRGNFSDCLIAYQIARRLNEEPLTVFQHIYFVNGRPGWHTEYMISRANKAGVFKNRITWKARGEGEALSVTATVTLDSGEVVSATCDYKMAKADGWTKNAKYVSMPEHMLRWRSAAMLIRLYAPEVMLGMPIVEELETLPPSAMRDVTPPAQSMKERLDAFAANSAAAPAQESTAAEPESTNQPTSQGQESNASANAAGGQPAPGANEEPPGAGANRGPKNEPQYWSYCNDWIAQMTDAAAGEDRWKKEKSLRNKCNVSPERRDDLEARCKAKCAELRKPKG